MTAQRALAKIQKLLALATSSNPFEAAAAARQAEAMMRKHGFVRDDVSLADVIAVERKSRASRALTMWETVLLVSVTDAFGCANFFSTRRVRGTGRVVIVGPKCQAELAAYTWDALKRQMRVDRKIAGAQVSLKGKAAKVWTEGWIAGVVPKIQALALPFTGEIARQYVNKMYPHVKATKPQGWEPIRDGGAAVRAAARVGYIAGQAAQLLTPMSADRAPAALGEQP